MRHLGHLTIDEATKAMRLTIAEISTLNLDRCEVWHTGGQPWTLADWGNALAGEVGEACNVIKKMRQIELGTVNLKQKRAGLDTDTLRAMLADEIADAYLYLDLLASHAGIDLAASVRRKFNEVSIANEFAHRL